MMSVLCLVLGGIVMLLCAGYSILLTEHIDYALMTGKRLDPRLFTIRNMAERGSIVGALLCAAGFCWFVLEKI